MPVGVYPVRVKVVAQYVRLSDSAEFDITVAPEGSTLLGVAAESLTGDAGVSGAEVSIGE